MFRLRASLASVSSYLPGAPKEGAYSRSCWADENPIRADLFGMERMRTHAHSLAVSHARIGFGTRGSPLIARLNDNARVLQDANIVLSHASEQGKQLTPAAEWLIDNYYLMDMQIQTIKVELPVGYYRDLPKLVDGAFAGLPRVFEIAWALVAHTDSHISTETIREFLETYQQTQPLLIRELWAVPINIRIVLIENLRRISQKISADLKARERADTLVDALTENGGVNGPQTMQLLAGVEIHTLSRAFLVQFAHRLRGHDPQKDPAFLWLDGVLQEKGTDLETLVHEEMQEQGGLNATIRNIINSIRLMTTTDWNDLVEDVSLVSRILAAHGEFAGMDLTTRHLYCRAVEKLAKGSRFTECDIASLAVAKAQNARVEQSAEPRRADPGYYLIAEGRSALEQELGFRAPLRVQVGKISRQLGITGYSIAVTLLTLLLLAAFLSLMNGYLPGRAFLLLLVLGFIPASDAVVSGMNRFLMWAITVSELPALELKQGIPAELRTMVVVPTLLTHRQAVGEMVDRLEKHYLASRDGDIFFALLTDWTDWSSEHRAGDEDLLEQAVQGIERLNRIYGRTDGSVDGASNRFLLLHRRRKWSEGEGKWIGWERKRGKLHELNRLLRGAQDTSFMPLSGQRIPEGVRYVVTLDSDTRLPYEVVRRLVGKLAHPLNRASFDPERGAVVEGYGILQPRVTPSLPKARSSTLFQRVFSSPNGIEPYTAAVSDLYQDMFSEGSFAGKGIYDIDAFEAALDGRVPEGTLLSHDLFEGVFARAGLVTDIEVIEEFPTDYLVSASRLHRWARGDWQLLPWIFSWMGWLPTIGRRSTPMTGIARWKMLDNLRRSLSAPMAVAALFAGWMLGGHDAFVWTMCIVATVAIPATLPLVIDAFRVRQGETLDSYLALLGTDLKRTVLTTALCLVFLADQACLMGDAIVRTLARVFVTRKHLLQWVTAAQAAEAPRESLMGYVRQMGGAILLGAFAFVLMPLMAPLVWLVMLPFACVWMLSPVFAWKASQYSVSARRLEATADETAVLRLQGRRTWKYFETFVTESDHFLPPDNFQEEPAALLARRTSPTNMGLYLLCVVAAHDFGWIGMAEAVERVQETLATMARLPKYRGHFYNWYSTENLSVLAPVYVSTVDSGNLAGHLITLGRTFMEWEHKGRSPDGWRPGVQDALALAQEELAASGNALRTSGIAQDIRSLLHELLENAAGQIFVEQRLMALVARAGEAVQSLNGTRGQKMADRDVALTGGAESVLFWLQAAQNAIRSDQRDGATGLQTARLLRELAEQARTMALDMEFGFLRNRERGLLSIGYVVNDGILDDNCYDLLASEARLASFFAIAKGDIPARDWFRLGRPVAAVARGEALVSWSGSMFEYLMPSLVMAAPFDSLLEGTSRQIVRRQIEYGQARETPWGISESAYNARDLDYNYQYSNFGVPGLGMKRGLAQNLVIAPYATALATMVNARKAVANFARLEALGAQGTFGFYEALDYTKERLRPGENPAIIRSYMAHHQGMSILAFADTILDGIMRRRFHAEPMMGAAELLLQERAPIGGAITRPLKEEKLLPPPASTGQAPGGRQITLDVEASPVTHLLSNGHYSVMLTAAGSGYSRWNGQAVTRWREDGTLDNWGSYVFLRDIGRGRVWSAGFQPCGVPADQCSVEFREDRATYLRQDGELTTTMDVLVSAEDDAELRRVSVRNTGLATVEIEVTSYVELALCPPETDLAHPAFARMFVQTEYLPSQRAIIATRRRRSPGEQEIWAACLVVGGGTLSIETDRARFVGRGRDLRAPLALQGASELSGSTGTVLDAAFAVRCRLAVPPRTTRRVSFWTIVASTRAALMDSIERHLDAADLDRALTLAWTHAQVQLRHLDIRPTQADLFQKLAGFLLYAGPTLRASPERIKRGAGRQTDLWGQGLSGDLPILLLVVSESEDFELARTVLRAQEYFRIKALAVDVVILNEHPTSYAQDLQQALETLVRSSSVGGGAGGVHLLRGSLMSGVVKELLFSAARVVLPGKGGSLQYQITLAETIRQDRAGLGKETFFRPYRATGEAPALPELELSNGYGGFTAEGTEYAVILQGRRTTPAPWINVISNPHFGFQVSAEGSSYTWSENSRENQLTPWSNDPVSNPPGEAFYLCDEDSRVFWSPVAAACPDETAVHVAYHGRGYSRFERVADGIASTMVQYVPREDPIRISRLRLVNQTSRTRTLRATAYVEWVLGRSRMSAAPFVLSETDAETGAIFARNVWGDTFGDRVAFADFGGRQTSFMDDRTAFLGRYGSLSAPRAIVRGADLPGLVGAGVDPCAALQTIITLAPGEETDIVFLLGQGQNAEHARKLIAQYRAADLDDVLEDVKQGWRSVTDALQVRTPDRAMDIMLNGWLLYQSLSSRIWSRAGFYQASGAYGFRDQLQDGMSLVTSAPALVRQHLLRAASRQFVEGDVQHWWLPQKGNGVRTRISDDCAWLAFTVAHYVRVSGDRSVLDEELSFLDAPVLANDEHERFLQPSMTEQRASLYEHCALALDHSLTWGAHGLPLMGTGDWNDGMNRVGEAGRGESVWLGWFLSSALKAFIPHAEARGDQVRLEKWHRALEELKTGLENAWDGEWYCRAYFDDGSPLGSHLNREGRIDAIAQSWAVISGIGDPERSRLAMQAVREQLVRLDDGIIMVLTPPFDKSEPDPGYIRGYPPGVRENGGQYTHAALWTVMATALLGDGATAHAMFATINPVHHARNEAAAGRYRLEPYVVAADVYSAAPHVGRGGWSWYTGSAGWMQRVGTEVLLGVRIEDGKLFLSPCIPPEWPGFEVMLCWKTATYRIEVSNPDRISRGVLEIRENGTLFGGEEPVVLTDDGAVHLIEVVMKRN
ncbi:glycosyl transferase [Gluconobacter sp. LMG 1745]|uniref:Glycosyl transferase n=2 Tax=Acetobacteraceae TaxID=433 RepID=A0ABR9YX13_9PROT|nr:glycosyl transferase [Gluconobacter cadivus]MBS1060834.1 glycosyl transferase [Gluconobacter sp. Dm-44]